MVQRIAFVILTIHLLLQLQLVVVKCFRCARLHLQPSKRAQVINIYALPLMLNQRYSSQVHLRDVKGISE